MPVYCYKCVLCDHEFEVRHNMNFENQKCLKCESSEVFKIPSLQEKKKKLRHNDKAGQVVDKFIIDTKKELKSEKQKLKQEFR